MGYSTDFEGELLFSRELKASELAIVNDLLGREKSPGGHYIDLEITDYFTGIKWNGAEKTYDMVETIAWLCSEMEAVMPDVRLTGKLLAQGEDHDDRWMITMVDGKPHRAEQPRIGQRITCPICEGEFTLEAQTND